MASPDLDAWTKAANRGTKRVQTKGKAKGGVDVTADTLPQMNEPRTPHEQSDLEEAISTSTFEACQFIARYLDCTFTRRGDMVVRFQVPRRHAEHARALLDSLGVPLSIDVQRWRRYDALRGNDPGPDGATGPGHEA